MIHGTRSHGFSQGFSRRPVRLPCRCLRAQRRGGAAAGGGAVVGRAAAAAAEHSAEVGGEGRGRWDGPVVIEWWIDD